MKINNLSQLNTQNRTIINIVIKVVILGLIIFFGILPIFTKITNTRDNIFDKKSELDRKNTQSKTYSKLSQTIDEISPQLKILDNVFISHNRELEFITTLEGIAQKNNVEQNIKLGDLSKKTPEAFFNVPLELSINGSDSSALNYLLDLENLAYYLNVKSVYILSKPDNKKQAAMLDENGNPLPLSSDSAQINLHIAADSYWKN